MELDVASGSSLVTVCVTVHTVFVVMVVMNGASAGAAVSRCTRDGHRARTGTYSP